jgi:hypothetical protein
MTKKSNVYAMPTLADHLSDCEERYQHLLDRFDQIDVKFNRLETGLEDIKVLLSNARYKIL